MMSNIIYQELTSTSKLGSPGVKFRIWKSKINFVLSELGVSYALTDPKPTEPNEFSLFHDKEQYQKWLKDDFTCRHAMLFAMVDDVFLNFEAHKSARDMMDALTKLFASTSMPQRIMLRRKCQNYKMPEGTDINSHIVKMGAKARELEEAGMLSAKEFHAAILLNSLPDSWQSAIEARMITDTTSTESEIDYVTRHVKDEAEMRACSSLNKEKDGELDEEEQKKGGFKGRCPSSGKYGHDTFVWT